MSQVVPFNLRRAYTNEGFSRRGFAKQVDVPEQSIRRLERGLGISPAYAMRVADYFGMKATDLLPEDAAA